MSSCIVTGCARGNGLAIAERLLFDGHFVVGIDQDKIPSEAVSYAICGDIVDSEAMEACFKKAIEASAGTVYLVNNAGVTFPESVPTDEAWNKTLSVNLNAPFYWSRFYSTRVQQGLIEAGGIVFIGSLATTMGFPNNPAYHASKAGLLGLTRSFAFDLGSFGIRSNCVSPGYIKTSMTNRSYATPELYEARRKQTLLGRWGQPADVAKATAFLCSSNSEYITGINLVVDGGWQTRGLVE